MDGQRVREMPLPVVKRRRRCAHLIHDEASVAPLLHFFCAAFLSDFTTSSDISGYVPLASRTFLCPHETIMLSDVPSVSGTPEGADTKLVCLETEAFDVGSLQRKQYFTVYLAANYGSRALVAAESIRFRFGKPARSLGRCPSPA